MYYVIDTEFLDRGRQFPVQLISLGVVSQDGRTYYAVDSEFNWKNATPWLKENVKPNLAHPHTGKIPLKNVKEIREDLNAFLAQDDSPVFFGYFADWDWLLFCHIWGGMLKTPTKFPHLCMDIEQERRSFGFPKGIYPTQVSTEHNALNDALWSKDCLDTVLLYKQKLLDRVGVGTV